MNWDQIAGKWKEFKGEAKAKWGALTDDELEQIDGDREKLEGRLQSKYGKTKEEIRKEVDDWLKG